MIRMLNDWVRDLVVIVIFASLLEMLLPDSSLRKYLKVVLGFFILLTVLNPILHFINADYRAFYPFNNLPGQRQQQAIQRSGEAIQKQNMETALNTYQRQLSQQIRGLILTQAEIDDAEVQVQATSGGQIQAVQVTLKVGNEETPRQNRGEVKPIRDVEIVIGSTNQNRATKEAVVIEKDERVQEKVRALLVSFYNLKPETISFK